MKSFWLVYEHDVGKFGLGRYPFVLAVAKFCFMQKEQSLFQIARYLGSRRIVT